jgi:hypothetical protein
MDKVQESSESEGLVQFCFYYSGIFFGESYFSILYQHINVKIMTKRGGPLNIRK